MTITIRPLSPEDQPRWRELFEAYVEFYNADIPEAQYGLTWQALMSDALGTHEGFCAVDERDQLIGFVHLLFHASTWSAAPYCYLEDLFVDPAIRGSGAGRALIEAVYERASEMNSPRVYWVTDESNNIARRLYDKLASKTDFIQYRKA